MNNFRMMDWKKNGLNCKINLDKCYNILFNGEDNPPVKMSIREMIMKAKSSANANEYFPRIIENANEYYVSTPKCQYFEGSMMLMKNKKTAEVLSDLLSFSLLEIMHMNVGLPFEEADDLPLYLELK